MKMMENWPLTFLILVVRVCKIKLLDASFWIDIYETIFLIGHKMVDTLRSYSIVQIVSSTLSFIVESATILFSWLSGPARNSVVLPFIGCCWLGQLYCIYLPKGDETLASSRTRRNGSESEIYVGGSRLGHIERDEFETGVSNRRTLVRGHRSSSSDSSDLSVSFN